MSDRVTAVDFLRVSEIFHSIQGESSSVGLPTVFIRLTGCPLRCAYCDTEYAFYGGTRMPLHEILDTVKQFDTPFVTVTGGEPLAQGRCLVLLRRLIQGGYQVSLETSGAIDLSEVDPNVVKVMDLKTPSSGETSRNLYQNLDYLGGKDQVKFVIGSDEDYEWAKYTLQKYKVNARCEVLFSPVDRQMPPAQLADRILHDRLPVRFQIQLHKLLWGDTSGK